MNIYSRDNEKGINNCHKGVSGQLELWVWAHLQTTVTSPAVLLLPRDASAERGNATVSRLSVCPSVRP